MVKMEMNGINGLRAMIRPMLLFMLGFGALVILLNDINTIHADWWMKVWFAALGEWIIERPIIKIARRS